MVDPIQVLRPQPPRNRLHHLMGLGLMAMNSMRHRVMGYRTPRPSGGADLETTWTYDRAVFANWTRHLRHYLGRDLPLEDRHVLEIGPGPDLGTGLLWLAAGAASYTAVDTHRLVGARTLPLHRAFAARLGEMCEQPGLADRLATAVEHIDAEEGALRYLVLSGFDLSPLRGRRYDLVVSHSALEHLRDVRHSFEQLSELVTERAHFVAEVDLQTHTRWIRDADPLNIYRYSAGLYRSLGFSGCPNRVRPDDYMETLERTGWYDLRLYPQRVLDPAYVDAVEPSLCAKFRGDPERMGWLSIVLCASRRGERSWAGAK